MKPSEWVRCPPGGDGAELLEAAYERHLYERHIREPASLCAPGRCHWLGRPLSATALLSPVGRRFAIQNLYRRTRARRAGRVQPPPYDDRRDPETLMLNPRGIADYAVSLAPQSAWSWMLGCSPCARGRLQYRAGQPVGAASPRALWAPLHRRACRLLPARGQHQRRGASSDLALATGRGPGVMTMLEGYCPLVRDEDVSSSVFATLKKRQATAASCLLLT